MPRTEKKICWSREEIKEILERKYNIELKSVIGRPIDTEFITAEVV